MESRCFSYQASLELDRFFLPLLLNQAFILDICTFCLSFQQLFYLAQFSMND